MKHSSDKYNLAWFKLAECVTRGERERALGVYRLLAHSLDDRAVALQLEGDILLAFKDIPLAVERYRAAAQAYVQSEKLHHAAAIYDHILVLQPDNHACLLGAIRVYRQLPTHARLELSIDAGVRAIINMRELQHVDAYVQELAEHIVLISLFHERLFMAMVQQRWPEHDVQQQLYKAIDVSLAHDNAQALSQFIARVRAVSDVWHEKAVSYAKDKQYS
jgi:tetratricopeptide (TPR) repeat protein